MMVHHSRNSEQKQWDETVVIALGGMAPRLRAHLPAIVGMDRVAGKWGAAGMGFGGAGACCCWPGRADDWWLLARGAAPLHVLSCHVHSPACPPR